MQLNMIKNNTNPVIRKTAKTDRSLSEGESDKINYNLVQLISHFALLLYYVQESYTFFQPMTLYNITAILFFTVMMLF